MTALQVAGVASALTLVACGSSKSACIKPESGKGCLAVAPASRRVDLNRPVFSNPRAITNPLHPAAALDQVIYGGKVDGKPFRTEFTRLAAVKQITWNGQTIPAIAWQYLAYSDGRIEEVAIDWFAQADDGSVWYLGEDVSNYKDGVVADKEGSWEAGAKTPGAMIMPAHPKVGDVYRPENAPGVVFEEVTVKAVNQTVPGPRGPVAGTITVSELHADGSHEGKIFAPGYGEFSTGDLTNEHETVSLAVPTDSTPGQLPSSLAAVSMSARAAHDAVAKADWPAAATAVGNLQQQWLTHKTTGVGSVLAAQMTTDIDALAAATAAKDATAARGAALRVAQNSLDMQLRFLPRLEVERARLDLWQRQLTIDSAADDAGAAAGDKATVEWIRQRAV